MQKIIVTVLFPIIATRLGVFGHDTIYYKGKVADAVLSQSWILFDTVTYTTQESKRRSYHIRPHVFTQS